MLLKISSSPENSPEPSPGGSFPELTPHWAFRFQGPNCQSIWGMGARSGRCSVFYHTDPGDLPVGVEPGARAAGGGCGPSAGPGASSQQGPELHPSAGCTVTQSHGYHCAGLRGLLRGAWELCWIKTRGELFPTRLRGAWFLPRPRSRAGGATPTAPASPGPPAAAVLGVGVGCVWKRGRRPRLRLRCWGPECVGARSRARSPQPLSPRPAGPCSPEGEACVSETRPQHSRPLSWVAAAGLRLVADNCP